MSLKKKSILILCIFVIFITFLSLNFYNASLKRKEITEKFINQKSAVTKLYARQNLMKKLLLIDEYNKFLYEEEEASFEISNIKVLEGTIDLEKLVTLEKGILSLHKEVFKLNNRFLETYKNEHRLRKLIQVLVYLNLDYEETKGIGDLIYKSKEAMFQYKTIEKFEEWNGVVEDLKTKAKTSEILNYIDEYQREAEKISLTLLEKEEILNNIKYKMETYSKILETADQKLQLLEKNLNSSIDEISKAQQKGVIKTGIIILLLIMISGMFLYRNILSPLECLKNSMDELANKNFNHKIKILKDDEIGQLAAHFNNMTFKLKQSYSSLENLNYKLLEEIGERKKLQETIKKNETMDNSTGLFTREHGIELFSEIPTPKETFVFVTNIQNMSIINSSLGIAHGDETIRAFANILKESVRKSDIITRVEGDKFMVILPGFSVKHRKEFLDKILTNLNNFNLNNSKELYIQITYLLLRYKGELLDNFITNALQQLNAQKKCNSKKDSELVQGMFEGFRRKQFMVYYQPKINIGKEDISYESLIRWNHPIHGLISPEIFIPLAEKSYLINRLTTFVLKEALNAGKKLNANISINISPIAFESNHFIDEVLNTLSQSDYSHLITFEITEGIAIKNLECTLKKMKLLKETGIRFSIDDFGTGYSSLSYLERLPVSEVKIDKSFIDSLKTKTINPLIIKFIGELSQILDLNVVAEGTETKEQIVELIKLGITSFQGFFFGRALPLEEVIENKPIYLGKLKLFK